jgi:hypothetical protein
VKAATDIVYAAEVAGYPTGAWSSSDAQVDQNWLVIDYADTQSVTARDKTSFSNAPSRYLRLKVTQP